MVDQGIVEMLGIRHSVTYADCDQVCSREWRKNVGLPKFDLLPWDMEQGGIIRPFAPMRYYKMQRVVQVWVLDSYCNLSKFKNLRVSKFQTSLPLVHKGYPYKEIFASLSFTNNALDQSKVT